MENGPVEDVFPIKNGDFYCHVSLLEGIHQHLLAGSRFIGRVVSELQSTSQGDGKKWVKISQIFEFEDMDVS